MFIDLRYHLTTIIAIFLSLGIGILIGTAMIGDDGIVMEQQKIIAEIEDDLRSLREQNTQFRTKISSLETDLLDQEQFVDQLFQDAITEKLEGLSCLWVPNLENTESADTELMEILQNAGLAITEYSQKLTDLLANEEDSTEGADLLAEDALTKQSWDFCILLTQGMPLEIQRTFSSERIFRPIVGNLVSKKGIYQFVKSLSNLKLTIQKDETNDNLSYHTSIQ